MLKQQMLDKLNNQINLEFYSSNLYLQMDLMNRNMASMSHSMGSTLGRAGSWVPW